MVSVKAAVGVAPSVALMAVKMAEAVMREVVVLVARKEVVALEGGAFGR